jgi:hypothetical protein
MEMRCQKCDALVSADQAFCSKCGAVVGMSDTAQKEGDEWNMAATMVGKKMPIPQPPRPTPESSRPTAVRQTPTPDNARPAPPPQHAYTPSQQPPTPTPARSGSNAMLLAIIGLVAVLLIGGLLALLFYLNSQG